ncbi:hypothetical protein RchiOBHm_Chr1g0332921 [Rosa chinensis]|uniref:Uncharacterized protein n=1 Tax=Rosa chinensis TaxID=74649 RepID=A0A2P6SC00_ROSCH|nr:hypothetical protein RchiOBHm_Chr1g0332921 [Rosa chinensis]
MSRSSSSLNLQVSETAPPRLLRLERRPTFGKKLETIEEENEQGGHSYNRSEKQPSFGSTNKAEFTKHTPGVVAR